LKILVLDANILMRAVLGTRVRELVARYGKRIDLVAPDFAFDEARKHLPRIIQQRNLAAEPFMAYFVTLYNVIQTVEPEVYCVFEAIARQRLARRDRSDWPILAAALALGSPIWTEDMDFFGCGVATWTSDRVELYLAESLP
jgi:predicted nucleic acid-binding protein